jgi:hypothetical protein
MGRYNHSMIWFFERQGERLQCEIRTAPASGLCELIWTASDGRTHVERADDPAELVRRRRALEQWLRLDGWVRLGRLTPPRVTRRTTSPVPSERIAGVRIPEQEPPQRVVVRRGQIETFELLKRTFAHDSGVRVIWDRRVADRRRTLEPTPENRRRTERRRRPPDQWHYLHYLVVPAADDATV